MNSDPTPDNTAASGGGAFPTTQWSVVLQAGAESESKARHALGTLCRHYWYPLYAFVRRQGRSHHEAEDCTQEFLARLLANAGVALARPERGRFRTFLLTALRNFLTDEWHRSMAAKRGGGKIIRSLDLEKADERFSHEPVDPGLTPEQAFDCSWAADLLDAAVAELQNEYQKSGRGELFATLQPLMWGNSVNESHADLAQKLGLNTHAFTVALQRLRRRLGERLRLDVAQTLADGSLVDAELRYLISALGGGQSAR